MQIRKLLLISLCTFWSLIGITAQTVNVHGSVTDPLGAPQAGITVFVTAILSDSSAIFETLLTDTFGGYAVELSIEPGVFGQVDVSMVDCWGFILTQTFFIQNGNADLQADFVYCENIVIDSCIVYIIEEWLPGQAPQLTAWVPVNFPAEFIWSTGETTQNIFPTEAGEYCVTATYQGCEVSDCYYFSADTNFFCFTYITSTINNDGTYNLEAVASGQAPFTYAWSTGDSTPWIENVGPGTYCVTVVDAAGCNYSTCTFIDDFSFCDVWISCDPGGGLTAFGYGQPPLQYLWNTGETTESIFPDEDGTYCVTVTDNNQCSTASCFTVAPDTFCYVYIATIFPDSNTIALQAIGTDPNATYLWSTGETSEIIYPADLMLEYCVTMTDPGGCTSTACFNSNYWCYAYMNTQYIDTNIAVLTVYTDPIFGGGPTQPTYLWSNGATSQTITVGESGNYCVTVTIGNSCTTETCAYVDFESLQNSCEAWVNAYVDPATNQWYAQAWVWGLGNFSYLWSNGDTNSITTLDGPNDFVCVTATSQFGCVAEACIDTFFNPCKAYVGADYLSNDIAVLTAWTYNSANNQYLWSNGETGQSITVNIEGTYCVTVTGGGCTSTACIEVLFWNTDSCGVWITQEDDPFGVLLTADAWGVAPFTFQWSNGWTEQTQIIDFGPTDLCVTVTDAVGCISTACNFPIDSCAISLWFSNWNNPQINISSWTPLSYITWSTGDSTPWLDITEPGEYCVTTIDVLGCEAYACITIDSLDPNIGFNTINGLVIADSVGFLQGQVYLFAVNPAGGAFTLVDSTDIVQGVYYQFDNLPNGVYVVRAELSPESAGYGDFVPTYHLSSAEWESATPISLPDALPVTKDIWMISIDTMNGGGVIGGVVTDPNHIVAAQDADYRGETGLAKVTVLLKNAAGEVIDYTVTLADGSFRFTGLQLGTYRLRYDIPGIYSPDVWVTLTAENPELLQVSLVVNETVSTDEPEVKEVNIYPNPATEEIKIQVPADESALDVRIVDMQGRIIYAGSAKSHHGIMLIEVGQYAPGLYHINLRGDATSYFGRFVKQE